ncbi:DUF3943 domain-containing protein [Vibrio sp. ZSDZ34]|uniref:DUF3943 domain-containing protein n=1 Tax=Vibrio gelatinilyticus TaxID=2893468 RepID=A0A9X1W9T8_9VIBR|nr:DUF3943 domain-containing protein [Vibrio gelatinilyticus]MCJ2376131.1 DUF3943 domain-containing protein [Vibrio gelatinilyticus]
MMNTLTISMLTASVFLSAPVLSDSLPLYIDHQHSDLADHWRTSLTDFTQLSEPNTTDFTIRTSPEKSNTAWEELPDTSPLYRNPYRVSLFSPQHGEDSARLWSQTKSIAAYGVGVAGVLALMPESITNWEKGGDDLFSKWVDNVSSGPTWDRDDWAINYLGHPYFGGVYYQAARKSGYRQWDSFIYSAMMSTFYWEYGIEAFAEVPSIQDLFVTPILGWVYGEWAYNKEQEIRLTGGTVWGSKSLGNVSLFLLDPVDSLGNGVNHIAGREIVRAGTGFVGVQNVNTPNGVSERQFRFEVQYSLDATPGSSRTRKSYHSQNSEDPVTYSIVGVSAGASYVEPSDYWELDPGAGVSFTVGLHFSPAFSGHLTYTRASLNDRETHQSVTYESYSANGLYYFNTDSKLRPFVTAGFGESLKNEDTKTKQFQLNAGAGLHYALHPNWALQAEWRHAGRPSAKASENIATGRLVYRFGKGEI